MRFFRGEAQSIDGVGGEAHGCGNGLGTGIKSCGIAEIVANEFGNCDRDYQTEDTLDYGEERLRHAILGDTANELRTDTVANRK